MAQTINNNFVIDVVNTILPPGPPTITVNWSSNAIIADGGTSASVAVNNGPGNQADWVAFAAAGAPDTSYIGVWAYLNGTHTLPSVGLTSAMVTLTVPLAAGSYEARFYSNDSTTVLARSNVTVQNTGTKPSPLPPIPPPPTGTPIGYSATVQLLGANFVTTSAGTDPGTVAGVNDTLHFAPGTLPGTLAVGQFVQVIARNFGNFTAIPKGTTVAAFSNTAGTIKLSSFVATPLVAGDMVMLGKCVYNLDGTVSGTPTGKLYIYNPDTPDAHQAAVDEGNFVSDFAGFTQRSLHCWRYDFPLRIYFRKDVSPNPNRIEVVLEYGYLAPSGNSSLNEPFILTINQGTTTRTIRNLPSMGWHSRWRIWSQDGTTFYTDPGTNLPRPEVRTTAQLMPLALNLVPNLSLTAATTYHAIPVGDSGSGGRLVKHYSSRWTDAPQYGVNDYNPAGINETTAMPASMEPPGSFGQIGLVTEQQAHYVLTGAAASKVSIYCMAELAGGMPYGMRDPSQASWPGPRDHVAFDYSNADYDRPKVWIPSGPAEGNGTYWGLDAPHNWSLSYIPYQLTGDPYYLENMQFSLDYMLDYGLGHRVAGWPVNYPDPNTPIAAANFPIASASRFTTRALAWFIRDCAAAYKSTPASVPSWLRPKSYYKQISSLNQKYFSNASGAPDATDKSTGSLYDYANNRSNLAKFGFGPGSRDIESGFFCSYLMGALGLAVNQCGLSEWTAYYKHFAKLIIGFAGVNPVTGAGASGWPSNWPNPYNMLIQPYSHDRDPNPAAIVDHAGMWDFFRKSGIWTVAWTDWSIGYSDAVGRSLFPAWTPSTSYICNSWIFEINGGTPVLPNVGDRVSITISGRSGAGKFSGKSVTLTDTYSAADIAYMGSFLVIDAFNPLYNHPVAERLMVAINGSAAGIAGMQADRKNHAAVGYWHGLNDANDPYSPGRIYLTFDSATFGDIIVSGSYAFASGGHTRCGIYIQPNGDAVKNGVGGPNLYGRPLNYQCAKTGVSGTVGPSGQALQTPTVVDGSCLWSYVPEIKPGAITVPIIDSDMKPPPRLMQIFPENAAPRGYPGQYGYMVQARSAMSHAVTLGIPGAAAAQANLDACLADFASLSGDVHISWQDCFVPYP